MNKYRIIIAEHRYSSYIVEAEDASQAMEMDENDAIEVVYEDDPGDYGTIEVISTKPHETGKYDFIKHDDEIEISEYF